jgi:hypothetical protein
LPGRDWRAWHEAYDEPGSPLAQRLAVVRERLTGALDAAPPGPLRVISMCAGQGRDLIPVLATHPRGGEVTARLVELDPGLAAVARRAAGSCGAYAGAAPAGVVLACGVFGNISDAHVRRTIGCLRQLCAAGGTVIWTRGRSAPDMVPQICQWFGAAGFEQRWVSAPGPPYGVGVHRYQGQPEPLAMGTRMFRFGR